MKNIKLKRGAKKHRPDATYTKIYVPSLEKLRHLSVKLDTEAIRIISSLVDDKFDKVCSVKRLSTK